MEKQKKKLQVGDVVYQEIFGSLSKRVIDRVTPSMAFSQGTKFKIEYDQGQKVLHEVGSAKWSSTYYYFETPELKEKWYLQNLQRRVTALLDANKIKKLTTQELEQVIKILES